MQLDENTTSVLRELQRCLPAKNTCITLPGVSLDLLQMSYFKSNSDFILEVAEFFYPLAPN